MKTTDVHHAMKEAQFRRFEKPELVTSSFKIDANSKMLVEEICARHGVTMSEFVRECCYGLVKDYLAPLDIDQ